MTMFVPIKPEEERGNVFSRIGRQWMLITAGSKERYNTMTASWGGLGVLWGKDVATCYIRPQRYTKEFVEREEYFTLSFLPEECREILNFCGTKSGRDVDKGRECGLVSEEAECGAPYFAQAELVLVCRKLYRQDMEESCFLDPSLLGKWYPEKDLHRMYVGEIEQVLKKV